MLCCLDGAGPAGTGVLFWYRDLGGMAGGGWTDAADGAEDAL